MNSDGSGLTQLTFTGGQATYPSINADGTKIAFMALVDDDDYEIFIVNSDGSGLTQLTSNTVADRHLSISADGTKIAFASGTESDYSWDMDIFLLELVP